jgi:hypothetical protein
MKGIFQPRLFPIGRRGARIAVHISQSADNLRMPANSVMVARPWQTPARLPVTDIKRLYSFVTAPGRRTCTNCKRRSRCRCQSPSLPNHLV